MSGDGPRLKFRLLKKGTCHGETRAEDRWTQWIDVDLKLHGELTVPQYLYSLLDDTRLQNANWTRPLLFDNNKKVGAPEKGPVQFAPIDPDAQKTYKKHADVPASNTPLNELFSSARSLWATLRSRALRWALPDGTTQPITSAPQAGQLKRTSEPPTDGSPEPKRARISSPPEFAAVGDYQPPAAPAPLQARAPTA